MRRAKGEKQRRGGGGEKVGKGEEEGVERQEHLYTPRQVVLVF